MIGQTIDYRPNQMHMSVFWLKKLVKQSSWPSFLVEFFNFDVCRGENCSSIATMLLINSSSSQYSLSIWNLKDHRVILSNTGDRWVIFHNIALLLIFRKEIIIARTDSKMLEYSTKKVWIPRLSLWLAPTKTHLHLSARFWFTAHLSLIMQVTLKELFPKTVKFHKEFHDETGY